MTFARCVRLMLERLLSAQITRVPAPFFPFREPRGTDVTNLVVLRDPAFRRALEIALPHTFLDTARLANLWQLCRMSNPAGGVAEIGTYRGGGALLLSQAAPDRRLFVCDTFAGFDGQQLDSGLDRLFMRGQFRDGSAAQVRELLTRHGADFHLIEGIFPQSDTQGAVAGLSFVHVDVDIHDATLASLRHVAGRCLDRALVVVDDYRRGADGCDRAVASFVRDHPQWAAFPLYPGQALLVHRSWFADGDAPCFSAV